MQALDLPFDRYERYKIIQQAIEAIGSDRPIRPSMWADHRARCTVYWTGARWSVLTSTPSDPTYAPAVAW